MLFFPRGQSLKEIVDPEKLAAEFQEAARISGRTTQYQWSQGAIPSPTFLEQGDIVKVRTAFKHGPLQTSKTVLPKLITGAHADLFQVPYNQGYQEIPDTSVTWTSDYPEMVFIVFSFQYIRAAIASTEQVVGKEFGICTFETSNLRPRCKVRIAVDETRYIGSGPYQISTNGLFRGTGMAERTERTSAQVIAFVPPGTHTVKAVASQSHGLKADSRGRTDAATYSAHGPTAGVCIGSRRMIVASFANGLPMGA